MDYILEMGELYGYVNKGIKTMQGAEMLHTGKKEEFKVRIMN